jgi:hypothetical protein
MPTLESRIEPPAELVAAARRWLEPVRTALGPDFLSAYLTGSVLTQGFDSAHSRINLLVVARTLAADTLDRLADSLPESAKAPHFDPMFMTRDQMLASLDVFPIEWLDLIERHLLLEGDDVFAGVDVPRTFLRLQCEHELRGKHLRLRHEYLASAKRPERLAEVLSRLSSGFHTLFRTLLRLNGETPPAAHERVIERVAALYKLDAKALLAAHTVRYSAKTRKGADASAVRASYRAFLTEIERLVGAIDELRVP